MRSMMVEIGGLTLNLSLGWREAREIGEMVGDIMQMLRDATAVASLAQAVIVHKP
jgi:hypothetical protein